MCMLMMLMVWAVVCSPSFEPPSLIIIVEICKAPTLRLEALNKHNITHIMYFEMENVINNLTKQITHNIDINKGSSIAMLGMHTHKHTHMHARAHTQTHTHTHVLQTDRSGGQYCLTEIFPSSQPHRATAVSKVWSLNGPYLVLSLFRVSNKFYRSHLWRKGYRN